MHNKKVLLLMNTIIGLLLLPIVFCGCGQKQAVGTIKFSQGAVLNESVKTDDGSERPLRIVVSTVMSPNVTVKDWRAFAEYIGGQLGRSTVLLQRKTYEEVNLLLANGDADISFMSTGAYCSYRGREKLDVAAMVVYQHEKMYNSYLIIRTDNKEIYSLADMRGKSIAFSDVLSYSGHMIVVKELAEKYQLMPGNYFNRYIYTNSHDKSLWAVRDRVVDGAAVDSLVYDQIQEYHPEMLGELKIVQVMGPIPIGPIVVRSDLPEQQKLKLRQVLLHMHEDRAMAASLRRIMIDRFAEPEPELYEPYKNIYDRMTIDL